MFGLKTRAVGSTMGAIIKAGNTCNTTHGCNSYYVSEIVNSGAPIVNSGAAIVNRPGYVCMINSVHLGF